MKIHSRIPGRLRVSHPKFKEKAILKDITNCLKQIKGITTVAGQPITGSILINYDETVIKELDLLKSFFEDFKYSYNLKSTKKNNFRMHKSNKFWRVLLHTGMLSTLGICVATGYIGSKKVHVLVGWIFVLIALEHTRINNKLLFR